MRWWDARVARDHRAMYDLFEPSHRARVPFEAFLQTSAVRSRFDLSEVRIDRIEPLAADRVHVWLAYMGFVPSLGRSVPATIRDTWVRTDGRWYKVYEPPQVPFKVVNGPSPPP
jgi:hypothetical protein